MADTGMRGGRGRFASALLLLILLAGLATAGYGVYAWYAAKADEYAQLDNLARFAAKSATFFFNRFDDALDNLGQDILDHAELRFTYVSTSAQQRLLERPDESLGKCRWEIGIIEGVTPEQWDEHKAALQARQPFSDFIYRYRFRGELRYASISGKPMFDADGRFLGYRGVGKDITSQRENEARIHYSSLAYLKRFPVSSLKIDRSFVKDVPFDADDVAITLAIIGLAHNLRIRVTAEGVETEAQRAFLRRHGCDEMQGYLSGRPLPIEEFAKLLSVSPDAVSSDAVSSEH